jgi:hypothetical protein
MRRNLSKQLITTLVAAFLMNCVNTTPAFPTSPTTRYVGPSGSIGDGSSCASPGYIGGSGISLAISAASSGDTITVCNGSYNIASQIFINNKGLTISGESTAENVILNGAASVNGIFKIISVANVTITKLTFYKSNNTSGGGAITLSLKPSESTSSTRHLISYNRFIQNYSSNGGAAITGGGADMDPSEGNFPGILTIYENDFIENRAVADGAAIDMGAVSFDETRVLVDSNRFLYNQVGRAGGAISSNFSSLITTNNYFYQNKSISSTEAQTLYGHSLKMGGGDVLMNSLTAGQFDCLLDDLGPTTVAVTPVTRTDNPYCRFTDGTTPNNITSITRAAGLALTGFFQPQSPEVSSSTVSSSDVELELQDRDSGGSSVTQYAYSLNGASFTNFSASGSGPLVIGGLSASTSYSVALKATSAGGTSAIGSDYSFTTSGISSPDAPIIGAATALSPTSASISFTAPTNNGGATIETYTAISNPGSITGRLVQAGSGAITIAGLTPSTTYTFTVTASNSVGTSTSSSASLSITTPASSEEMAERIRAAQKAAEAAREAAIRKAKSKVLDSIESGLDLTISDLSAADLSGITSKNIVFINLDLSKQIKLGKVDFDYISKIVKKYATVDKIALKQGNFTFRDLEEIGLIEPSEIHKTSIVAKLRALEIEKLDSYEKLQIAVSTVQERFRSRSQAIKDADKRIQARKAA